MRRRDFIKLLGYAAAWPHTVSAQQPAMPVIGFLSSTSGDPVAYLIAAEGQYDRLVDPGPLSAPLISGQQDLRWGLGRWGNWRGPPSPARRSL